MRKLSGWTLGIFLGICLSLAVAATVYAGPMIEFGDESYLQVDVKLQGIIDYTDFGSGKNGDKNRFDLDLRRARLVFTGMYNENWGVKFQTCGGTSATRNFGAGGFALSSPNSKDNSQIRLVDAYLIGMLSDVFNIKLGLTKIPLTRANLDECFSPLSSERSAFVYTPFGTDATKNSRDMGLVVHGNFFENHMKYWFGIMEGREGTAKFENPFTDTTFRTSPEPKSNLEYVARVHWSFLDPELKPSGSGYKGTYLGKNGKILTIGAAAAYEANAAFKNTIANGTDATVIGDETVDYKAYTADIFFEYPFADKSVLTATALYLRVDLDDAYKTARAPADLNTIVGGLVGQREGWYAKLGYILPWTVGEKGKLQPFARYERWDMANLFGVDNQRVDQYGAGINYYLFGNDKIRFTFEYSRTNFDKPTRLGDFMNMTVDPTRMTRHYDTLTGMVMVVF